MIDRLPSLDIALFDDTDAASDLESKELWDVALTIKRMAGGKNVGAQDQSCV